MLIGKKFHYDHSYFVNYYLHIYSELEEFLSKTK